MNEIIFTYLNSFALRYEWFDMLLSFLAGPVGAILIVGLAVMFIYTKDKKEGLKKVALILFSAGLAWVIARIIKNFYFSPRPFIALDNINLLFEHGNGDSMPSGHATFFFALASAVYFYFRKFLTFYTLYFIGALLIGAARIIAGVHWPLDILAGYLLGGFVAWFVYRIYKKINTDLSLGHRGSK